MPDTIYNPFTGADEVMVRDERGELIVVRPGAVPPPQSPVSSTPLRPISPPPLPSAPIPRPIEVSGDLDQVVSQLAAAAGVTFTQPTLARRMANVVLSRVKDIRSPLEVHEIFVRPAAIGGLGLTPAAADTLGRVLELQLPKLIGRTWLVPPPPIAASRPATPAPAAPVAFPKMPPVVQPAVSTPATAFAGIQPMRSPALPPLPSGLSPVRPQAWVTPMRSTAPVQSAATPTPIAAPTPETLVPPVEIPPAPAVTPAAEPSRPQPFRHSSSSRRTELVGPVDELGRFTVVDFRRLDPNPVQAAGKIRALFNALEKESFASRAAGMTAWRSSELYGLYTTMGSESLASKLSIEAVGAQRQAQGQPALTVAEFEAIMDLNQQLRF